MIILKLFSSTIRARLVLASCLHFFAAFLIVLGLSSWTAALNFNWIDFTLHPNPDPFFSGAWSDFCHWDNGTFIPSSPNDHASIALSGVPDYVVTLDLDTHIGSFNLDSPAATLDAVGRVFRVDLTNDFTQGVVHWDNSQILDSDAGTFTNAVTMDVTRTVLLSHTGI